MTSSTEPRPIAVDRRKLVRAGVWSVPVISIASAAPAFAASGCCDLSATGSATWESGELNYIDVNLDITNECQTAVSGLTVMITICGIEDIVYNGDDHLPAGWTQVGQPNKELDPDGNGCYTLTYMTAGALGGGGSTSVTFVPKTTAYDGTGGNRPGGTITVVVSSGGCSSDPLVIDLPAVG